MRAKDIFASTYHAEFLEGDFSIEVSVGFDNGAVDKLLKLGVVQIVSHHHFEDLEELTIRDEAVVVDVVDLEGEAKLLLLARAGRQRIQTLDELEERDISIVVAIEHSDHTSHQRVIRKFYRKTHRHIFKNPATLAFQPFVY